MTNSDLAMQIQANVRELHQTGRGDIDVLQIGGLKVARPRMRESTALGSALLAGHALKLFGWDISDPDTLSKVNAADVDTFEPQIDEKTRMKMVSGWDKAVKRAMKWQTPEDEDEAEERYEREKGEMGI